MKHFALESFALLVFFELQKDWRKVEHYLIQASNDTLELSMSILNYGEVFYTTIQRKGLEEVHRVIKIVDALPINIVSPDKAQTILAGLFKAEGGISYADCFATALTKKLNATLVTGDPEFRKPKDEISIEWIEK